MEKSTKVTIEQTAAFPDRECERAFNVATIHLKKQGSKTAKEFYDTFFTEFALNTKSPKAGYLCFGWLEHPKRLGLWLETGKILSKEKVVFAEISEVSVLDFGLIADPF